jgi:hypothetical protein
MKIAIMQPYFFPYIGYFQLINSVDVFVNLDHVNFMKRSYMSRNIIKNGIKINVPIKKATQNKKCFESYISVDSKYLNKFKDTIKNQYKKECQFDEVYHHFFKNDNIWQNNNSISNLNLHFIRLVCSYLKINTKIIDSSVGLTVNSSQQGLIDIVNTFRSDSIIPTYINAIGGMELYEKQEFAKSNIDLKFIKMGDVDFDNPFSSILDLIFRYKKETIINELKKYTLL